MKKTPNNLSVINRKSRREGTYQDYWNTKIILTTKFEFCFSEAGREKQEENPKGSETKTTTGKNLPGYGLVGIAVLNSEKTQKKLKIAKS